MIRIAGKIALAGALVCSFGLLWAQQDSSPSGSTAPDNTRANQSTAPTADQQSNSSSDLEMTRQIRKALVNDKSLSTYGHNVKIITQQGTVTLKGPVKSEAEKQEIESKATEVAGSADKVHSELRVAGSSKKPSASSDQNP
jgi:hyperosmotically inducible periplasmic protein